MSENQLIAERKNKINTWNDLGFPGYANSRFERSHTAFEAAIWVDENDVREAQVIMKKPDSVATLAGRLVAMREMGKLAFLKLEDQSGDFQICLAAELLGDDFKTWLKSLDIGDFVGFSGEFFKTKHGEPSLMVTEITPLAKSLRPLPEKWHGLSDKEACYRERNLDLISNRETLERFTIRSRVTREVRRFYEDLGFLEVETSILTPQAGGAMAETFSTHHNALDHNFHLRIALELPLKMVCSGGIERVFEIGKCFRNEGTDPSHLQEFTMLEWYAAYCDIEDNKRWNEQMLRQICQKVFGRTEFEILDKEGQKHSVDFGKKFPEYPFAQLLKDHANLDMFTATDDQVRAKAIEVGVDKVEGVGRANLLDDIYKKTARPKLIEPCFVLDYPEDLKPLAAPKGDGTASCFQVLVGGWEIINAYGELIDPQVQRALLERQAEYKAAGDAEAMEVDEGFLKAMEHGFPPMTGQGMGIDRLVALLTQQPNLRDVVLFPTMKPENNSAVESGKKETMLATAVINTALIEADWQALNTVGHLAAAYGAREGKGLFFKDTVETQDGASIKLNTTHAIMIKQTLQNKAILELKAQCETDGLKVAEFTREMLETSDDKKVAEITAQKDLSAVDYFGLLVYGKKSAVEKVTAHFGLLSELETSQAPSTKADLEVVTDLKSDDLVGAIVNEDGSLSRDKAWELVQAHCDWALQRHLAHVAASMEAYAVYKGFENERDKYYVTGLLHDIDWNSTIDHPELHCAEPTMELLRRHGVSEEICTAIQTHHEIFGLPVDTDLKKALLAVDEISGFAVAVALMRPTKMIGLSPKSVTKKMKDKQFAAAVDRGHMKYCETHLDIPVSEFLQILIPGWEEIAEDWELA